MVWIIFVEFCEFTFVLSKNKEKRKISFLRSPAGNEEMFVPQPLLFLWIVITNWQVTTVSFPGKTRWNHRLWPQWNAFSQSRSSLSVSAAASGGAGNADLFPPTCCLWTEQRSTSMCLAVTKYWHNIETMQACICELTGCWVRFFHYYTCVIRGYCVRVDLGMNQNSPTVVFLRQPCSQFFPAA